MDMISNNMVTTTLDPAAAVAGTIAVGGVLLFILCLGRIIDGILCMRLAAKKGYSGYFFTGFFLGLLGLLYVHFLPDRKIHRYLWQLCSSREHGAGHGADDE